MSEDSSSAGPRFIRLAIAVGTIFLALFTVDAVVAFRYGPDIREVGWDGARSGPAWIVRQVSPGGPAAGLLRPGDIVTALNGDPSILAVPPHRVLRRLPGGPYTLTLQRGAEKQDVRVAVIVTRQPLMLARISINLILSLVYFFTGMLIAFAKPNESLGWRAWASSLTTGAYIAYVASNPTDLSDLRGNAAWVPYLFSAVFPLHFVASYRFLSVFPVNFTASRLRRAVERTLIGGGWVVWALGAVVVAATMASIDRLKAVAAAAPGALEFLDAIQFVQLLFMGCAIVATAVACIQNYRMLSDKGLRRRLRWVFAGIVVSAVPMMASTAVWVVWAAMGIDSQRQSALAVMSGISNLLVAAVPISITYAVLKHRVLGIGVVVRRGVQYLLAANALRLFVALPVLGLAAGIVANPNRTIPQLLFEGGAKWNSVLLVLAAVGLRYRLSIGNAIDRKFFRESYNQERILAGLVGTITEADSVQSLCSAVTAELEMALHPEHTRVYIYEKHEMTLAHSSMDRQALPSLPAHCEAFDILAKGGSAVQWSVFTEQYPEDCWTPLSRLEADLLVPILSTEHKFVGLLVLGPKKSEEPYTARDRKMLESIASQIGVIQENLSLRSLVNVQRTAEREVLARLGGQQIDIVKECPACGRCFSSTVSVCERDGVELALTIPVERTIDARYRLDRLLGRGGMGAVYEAVDLRLNRAVAIKVMKGGLFGDPRAVRRFNREAQAAARLNHPNIVRIFDFGSLAGDGAYQVLELVPGRSWRAALNDAGQWPPQYALPLLRGVLEGLGCAHDAGIVHRDLKPENILLAPPASPDSGELTARVLDFGLAKIREEEMTDGASVTRPGVVMGTHGYMSPEHLAGREVDQRSDIYSFGVILLETLTGPLRLKQFGAHEQIQDLVKSRFEFSGATPAHLALRDVIAGSVAPKRRERYASAAEVRAQLEAVLPDCPPLPDGRAAASLERLGATETVQVSEEENP